MSLVLCLALFAAPLLDPGEADADVTVVRDLGRPRAHGVGLSVGDVELDGTTLRDLASRDGTEALVVVMRDAGCPLCKKGRPALERLVAEQRERGVRFVFVYPGPHQGDDDVRDDLDLPDVHVVLDPDFAVAAALGARTTTETLVVDRAGTLRFRGAVDDQYGIGFTRPSASRRPLADALDDVLAERVVRTPVTTAPGCVLEYDAAPAADAGAPTYHRDVARLVQHHCVTCHRDGGVGPFPLDSYDDVSGRKGMIRYVLSQGLMPPWGAAPGSGPWSNDRTVSDADLMMLETWAASGMPEGDPADAPLPVTFDADWEIGEPDVVYALPEPNEVPAEGVVQYQYSYVQTDGDTDRWLRAVEVRPSAPDVVHHVLVFVEEPKQDDESWEDFQRRERGGLTGYFAAYVPGQGATIYGDGFGKKLPANAWLKFQIHYTPNGRAASDRTEIGFVFADEEPEHVVRTSGIFDTRFRIPPGADDYVVEAAANFGKGATLLGFSPHMHLRGKSFRYVAVYPDGEQETLLDVPRYDFDWQTMYRLETPKTVPGGTRIVCVAHFDNSDGNPANPDPSRAVRFGEQTFDEMMIGYLEWWR